MFPNKLIPPLLLLWLLSVQSPLTAQETLCPNTPPSYLALGSHGRTTISGQTNLRTGSSTNAQIILQMEEATEFDVIGGPECGSYTWWQIQLANGTVGWAVVISPKRRAKATCPLASRF